MTDHDIQSLANYIIRHLDLPYDENVPWSSLSVSGFGYIKRLGRATYAVLECEVKGENIHRLRINRVQSKENLRYIKEYLIDSSLSEEENVLYCEMQNL